MPKVTIHQRSLQFSIQIVRSIRVLPRTDAAYIIRRQLIRSATSIGANIVEAQHSGSKQEFLRFLQISLRSAQETVYWLRLLQEELPSSHTILTPLFSEATQLSKIIATILMNGKRNMNKS